ncbi:serine-type D-Ala-D-Ala carboxypeptidase [Mycoplasma sp. CAG:611]|jgi:serine-type D-ala-D-ala carboxypeptidase|nr:serine-type D-Ala-D-Ala carboxypeptidase [Mycoplasma sp. CAG:611]
MKKISIIILLSLFLNIIPISVFAKNNEENSDVNLTKHATSSILVEATTGEIIYKQNPNKISSVASLTKMMGLIIIFDFINKGGTTYDEIITVSSYAKSMGGTQLYLETGEKISVNDLIKGIIMVSANDAMVAMAERVSGTEEAFVKKMNLKAKELGLKNTHFVNCTGFDEENHYSTASDMVKIAMELVNNYPEIYKFSSVYESYVRENTSNKTWIANTNKPVYK